MLRNISVKNTFLFLPITLMNTFCEVSSQKISNGTSYGQQTLKNSIQQKNVYGRPLEICSLDPLTGFYRDGYSRTDDKDHGSHVVCARVTKEFLDFTKSQGNDLSTPHGRAFPGLKPGDYWSLCALRWLEAKSGIGRGPPVNLAATNEAALRFIPLAVLEQADDKSVSGDHDEL